VKQVKKFKVRTRLSTMAFTPGGISVKDALARADVAIEKMRDPSLAAIDTALAAMEMRFGPANAGRDNEPPDELYELSSSIIDVAVCVRDTGIDQGAKALCDLVDLSGELGVWDWEAVDLHISTLRMLRSGGEGLGAAERGALIDGLLKVTRKRIGDPKSLAQPAAG
jgi:hypothetical protein